jgi:hypothetical protein
VGRGEGDRGARCTAIVDGSGLDPGNRLSCESVLRLLEADGPDGPLSSDLPVAAETGTLRTRFGGGAAEGVLRAKTGSLNGVTSLAGHVALPDGGVATFAYLANADLVAAEVLALQAFLAEVLASYRPPCPASPRPTLDAPDLAALAATAASALGATPGDAVVAAASTAALQGRASSLVDRCTAEAGSKVVLRRWLP